MRTIKYIRKPFDNRHNYIESQQNSCLCFPGSSKWNYLFGWFLKYLYKAYFVTCNSQFHSLQTQPNPKYNSQKILRFGDIIDSISIKSQCTIKNGYKYGVLGSRCPPKSDFLFWWGFFQFCLGHSLGNNRGKLFMQKVFLKISSFFLPSFLRTNFVYTTYILPQTIRLYLKSERN